MIIILMGVSGAGKTTVGRSLATQLGWPFFEGDDFHPSANINKMMRGEPLTDSDRRPWLEELHRLIIRLTQQKSSALIACSALKQAYRDYLKTGAQVRFVYLKGSPSLLRQRLQQRQRHYMQANMLESQLNILDEPQDALTIDTDQPIEKILQITTESLFLVQKSE